MALMDLSIDERLECLQELLSCSGRMYTWVYDGEGTLMNTNCPDPVLDVFFTHCGCMEAVFAHAEESRMPIVLSVPYGLVWGVAFERPEGKLERIHVFGPVTPVEISHESIGRAARNSKVTLTWRPKLVKILARIPTVSNIDFFRHILMLHYCITGERITNSDIVFREPQAGKGEKNLPVKKDRAKTYMTEQALLRMVREGDLNYKKILQDAVHVSRGVHMASMGSLDQVKVSQIVFISLCTRAAIEGGISPEIAYSRGDAYIQDVMDSRSLADAAHIGHSMYEDFIRLVRKEHAKPEYSPQIQSCCDYIELHAEDKLTLSEIAKHIGYVDYYLSRKFRAETGQTINDYIKTVKVERAKTLLIGTDMSIQEICDRLHFGSRSFFAETFRQIAGLPPAAFREQNRRL